MQLRDLNRYGISERIIELWRKRQGELLLPIQRRAIRHGLLDRLAADRKRRNRVISAPTSAGKSFCAELAAARALGEQRRVVMLFPLRSLAEEKFRLFRRTYGPLGIKCLILTGDRHEYDRAFAAGDYHIALAIHEKFDLALTNRLDQLRNIGLVVVDEIQMISEPGRGAGLERLLTKILASAYRPEIIALSAVLGERRIEPLIEWLEADLVEETARPRDLIRGIAADGRFNFRSYNDGFDGAEPFESAYAGDADDQAKVLARRIKADGGRTLIFLKSRADTVNLALQLAAVLDYPAAKGVLDELVDEESSFLLRSLMQSLGRGVAFHNSDLSGHQREAVETGFCSGDLTVLCSTTTLALGVNLPADTVYLETVKYASGAYDSRPELVPISRAEFDNMTGRAGRLGYGDDKPGKAVVMAQSVFDSEILWNAYIAPVDAEPVQSAWTSLPVEDWVLNIIVSGLARNERDLETVYQRTLRARLRTDDGSTERARSGFDEALARLRDHGLIERREGGVLVSTPVAAAAAGSGLSTGETRHYLGCLRDHGHPESPFGWTCLALSSGEWTLPPAVLTSYEQANNVPVRMLYRRFDHSVEEAVPFLSPHHRRQPLSYRAAATLKSALVLEQWGRLAPVQKLEERFYLHLGQIQYLGRTAAHLTAALARLIGALDRESDRPRFLAEHAFSLRFGLPASYQALHRHLGEVLKRSDFLRLREAGIENLEDLADRSEGQLTEIFSGVTKSPRVIEIIDKLKEEVEMQPTTLSMGVQAGRQPSLVEIDGTCEADRYLVKIDGFPIRLTGKSFKYLTKLAWSRVNHAAGWIYKEDIEVGFNQARYLYRMKNEINAGIRSSWPVVENNRLGYYRLHIDPDKIRLNLDNLRTHPDYELRSLFEADSAAGAVN